MVGPKRIGVWFGQGLECALAARAMLGQLQAKYPDADWVILGPRESLFLFEMDERVPVYIPLKGLEPRRPAQTRLSYYLEKRTQFKKLRGLQLDLCLGVSVLVDVHKAKQADVEQFQHVQKMLGIDGHLIQQELSSFLQIERPLLQAGPQALAYATQLYRKALPSQSKVLALLYPASDPASLNLQWQAIQNSVLGLGNNLHLTIAVVVGENRLLARYMTDRRPDWLQVGLPQAMGLIAYADRVICDSEKITRICSEMGRSDRLLLVKSHS